ncbi:gamma-glutamyltransferase [Mangrovimonas sp. CR14]|uniref:gamma-glutamyltransferase n=1 Tax=Mangrovimonas sp. CR14 TaxID=2706120 RepID=UPI001F0F36F3|nr:gamma-glutamyltransferase [Mangrovimonas sp. CR14]
MRVRYLNTILAIFLVSLISCNKPKNIVERGLITKKAMVVSARKEASKIGSDIMKKGGNAFDAMFATHLALAVAYPYAGNLGGGGFLVYRLSNGEVGSLDFREKAPMNASETMYLDVNGEIIPNKSTLGIYAVGVPGSMAGLFEAHERFGSMPIKDLIKPVIELARKGVVVTKHQEGQFKKYDSLIHLVNGKNTLISKNLVQGDTLKNLALAKTLERIANNGKKEFYHGQTAEILIDYIQKKGGILTMEDLSKYVAKWRNPIIFDYKDLKIISMAPPASGGICLAQMMKMVESFPLKQYGHNSLKAIQVMTEAERRSFADRSYYLGDPDFVNIPTDSLIATSYLGERMASFSFDQATSSSAISHGNILPNESDETTHYSIVDPFGNAIAVTTTLNGAYGSKVYVDELGFFLNNEMDDFSSKPGQPNMFGLIGAEANKIEPEKRMLSSMTPTIVEKNNDLYLTLGTPGGSTIITSVFQTILNVYEFEMSLQQAVNAPRFHHQWLPDEIVMEPNEFSPKLIDELEAKGYKTNQVKTPVIGKVDGILKLGNGSYEAGADSRGDDTAIGF